ncbi:hypothetical protein [Burkholderia ubonensis]|uniref:hypothetical protein n=1 Tax=Burkholderia ubonensis TaxID=101571 RepID=UPI000ABA6DBD|nr:hypothetical protein [Burkholderia ubonensis]
MATTLDEDVLPEIVVVKFKVSGGQVTSGNGKAPLITFVAAFNTEGAQDSLPEGQGSLQGPGAVVWAQRPARTKITIRGNYWNFPSNEDERVGKFVRTFWMHLHGYIGPVSVANWHGIPPAPFPLLDLTSVTPRNSKTGTANYTIYTDPKIPDETITVSDATLTELSIQK